MTKQNNKWQWLVLFITFLYYQDIIVIMLSLQLVLRNKEKMLYKTICFQT